MMPFLFRKGRDALGRAKYADAGDHGSCAPESNFRALTLTPVEILLNKTGKWPSMEPELEKASFPHNHSPGVLTWVPYSAH